MWGETINVAVLGASWTPRSLVLLDCRDGGTDVARLVIDLDRKKIRVTESEVDGVKSH